MLEKKEIKKKLCHSNSEAIKTSEFDEGLEHIFTKIFGPENSRNYFLLVKKLIKDKPLTNHKLDVLEKILATKGLLIHSLDYILNNKEQLNKLNLDKYKINPKNIERVLMAKIISQKVKIILGSECETDPGKFVALTKTGNTSNEKGEKNTDVFGSLIHETKSAIVYKIGNTSVMLNKLTKEFKKFMQVKSIVVETKYKELGEIEIDGKYRKVKPIAIATKTYFEVQNNEGQYGIINKKGAEIIPCKYYKIEYNEDYGYKVTDSKLNRGIINKEGNILIPCGYKKIKYDKRFGYLVVNEKNKIGIFAIDGTEISTCKYDGINGYISGIGYLLRLEQLFGVLDLDGKEIEPFIHNRTSIRIKAGKIQIYHLFQRRKLENMKYFRDPMLFIELVIQYIKDFFAD